MLDLHCSTLVSVTPNRWALVTPVRSTVITAVPLPLKEAPVPDVTAAPVTVTGVEGYHHLMRTRHCSGAVFNPNRPTDRDQR